MSSKLQSSAMDTASVSKSYYTALSMVHEMTNELYEQVHTDDGEPILNEEYLYNAIQQYKKIVRGELDMIKSAAVVEEERTKLVLDILFVPKVNPPIEPLVVLI